MEMLTQVAQVAAAIDRVFRDAMRECGQRSGRALAERHGPGAGALILDLRTILIDDARSVAPADFAELMRYADPAEVERTLGEVEARGMITRDPDGRIRGTAACRAFLTDVYEAQARVLADHWSPPAVEILTPMLGHLVNAALADAPNPQPSPPGADTRADEGAVDTRALRGVGVGSALGATSPAVEPVGLPDTVRLLNRLSTMRYHRSDAHAAAWREAGLNAAEMVALQERGGARRDAIERRTDEVAASAYAGSDLPGLIFWLGAILRHHTRTSEV
jgi:hypothetical protein